MFGEDWTGLLLVASAVFGVICLIVFEGVRTRLRSIPEQAHLLNQQIAAINMENQTADLVKAKAEQMLEEISTEVEETETNLLEARQALHEIRNRLPTVVYVLDQIIQQSHKPWLVIVRNGSAEGTKPGTVEGEWARGRRTLVFAENAGNVRRRIQARYPAAQGYHLNEPQSFDWLQPPG